MRDIRRWLLILTGLLVAVAPITARAADITVFAAASLKEALSDVESAWASQSGHHAALSFAASSILARQIEAGGPADVFISADTDWMDYLDKRGLIDRRTRRNLLGNHLVLIEPASSNVRLAIAPQFNLLGALHGGRLALADPASVPAGKYAKAALTTLEVWSAVADHIAPAENVRAALAYVARSECPLGIVYTTDALAEPQVRIAGTFADTTHPPIVYPVATVAGGKPLAAPFVAFLEGDRAASIFRAHGFVVLGAR